jgi:hypothetical protein
VALFATHLRKKIAVHVVAVKDRKPLSDTHGGLLWRMAVRISGDIL